MRSCIPAAFAFAVLALAPLRANATVPADSSAARGAVRVLSDRALFDLNPRPVAGVGGAAARDTLGLPSPGGAFALTAGGALAPVLVLGYWNGGGGDAALAGTALAFAVLGPSLGYWYAGIPGDAVPGQLLRLGAIGLFSYGMLTSWDSGDVPGATLLATTVLAGVAYIGGTLYDVGNVAPAVERANARRRAAAGVGLRPLRDGSPALAATVRF